MVSLILQLWLKKTVTLLHSAACTSALCMFFDENFTDAVGVKSNECLLLGACLAQKTSSRDTDCPSLPSVVSFVVTPSIVVLSAFLHLRVRHVICRNQ